MTFEISHCAFGFIDQRRAHNYYPATIVLAKSKPAQHSFHLEQKGQRVHHYDAQQKADDCHYDHGLRQRVAFPERFHWLLGGRSHFADCP